MEPGKTVKYTAEVENVTEARKVILSVYAALREKGYNPVNQIMGYVLSGDPTYITNHLNARSNIMKIERDELVEELVRSYLEGTEKG
ncbi:MAG: IreB family regulatory phosphoprotein [Oscillospiraceae bacterium]|nr:IreB family regulatory phosphoprotein [Oscillospiraceae bacterium]